MNKRNSMLFVALFTSALLTEAGAQQPSTPSKASAKMQHLPPDVSAFLKKNPTVANIGWKSGTDIILTFKKGSEQTFNLADAAQKQSFESLYGTAPTAPPPPPPVLMRRS